MTNNYLITGYWGETHVTAENDRGFNAAVFGAGRFVLPVGEMFRAEYIGNNTVRVYDGKLLDGGALAGIPAGKYIDFLIPEAGQGMNRNDLIIFEYSQDASTLIESGVFKVVSGVETSGTAADPVLYEEDILSDEATLDQMALFRVPVSGAVISAPEIMFNTKFPGERIAAAHSENGVAYTAELPGISNLYNGLEITIIPDKESTSTAITLNVNGLGEKYVRLPQSFNTAALAQPEEADYFAAGRPVKLMYDATYLNRGSWVVSGKQSQSAQDLYGSVITNKTISLTASDWSNNKQTVSATGVTADNNVFVSPAPASHTAYCESGVRCTAQAAGSLTFTCDEVPDSTLSVNLAIID